MDQQSRTMVVIVIKAERFSLPRHFVAGNHLEQMNCGSKLIGSAEGI
jgi:hypothetical protein